MWVRGGDGHHAAGQSRETARRSEAWSSLAASQGWGLRQSRAGQGKGLGWPGGFEGLTWGQERLRGGWARGCEGPGCLWGDEGRGPVATGSREAGDREGPGPVRRWSQGLGDAGGLWGARAVRRCGPRPMRGAQPRRWGAASRPVPPRSPLPSSPRRRGLLCPPPPGSPHLAGAGRRGGAGGRRTLQRDQRHGGGNGSGGDTVINGGCGAPAASTAPAAAQPARPPRRGEGRGRCGGGGGPGAGRGGAFTGARWQHRARQGPGTPGLGWVRRSRPSPWVTPPHRAGVQHLGTGRGGGGIVAVHRAPKSVGRAWASALKDLNSGFEVRQAGASCKPDRRKCEGSAVPKARGRRVMG